MAIHWSTPAWLWPLLLIVAVGAVLWVVRAYGQTRPTAPEHLGRVLIGLRSAAMILLVLAIAGPILSRLGVERLPAEIVVVLEDSGSMTIGDGGSLSDDAALQSRWQQALQVAARIDSTIAAVSDDVVRVYLRGNGLVSPAEFRLNDPVVPVPVNHGTDLGGLKWQVNDRLAGRPMRAMVLISDGQETTSWGDGTGEASQHRSSGTPFFVVGVGDQNGPPDRVLKDLRYPDAAYEGDRVVVEFSVDHRYLPETTAADGRREVRARLRGPNGVVGDTTITSSKDLVPFEMTFTVTEEGLQAYDLSVDVLDNERFPANNQATLAINVRQERARVLLLSATPSWDIRFLAQAAHTEQRMTLAVVYPGANGLVFADSLTSWPEPSTAEDWLAWDAVVLSGWTGALANMDWSLLAEAVDQGLGLLVMAGSGSGAGGGPVPFPPPEDLVSLLPVTPERWRWLPGPFFAASSAASVGHPVLEGLSADGANLNSLPPLAQVAEVKANPGAELLLRARGRAGARGLGTPLLVVSARGQGRVAWFGGRHLWELAFWESDRGVEAETDPTQIGRRLTRNLLVWSAAGVEESGLAFTGRQTFFHEGEPIRLAAQWRDMRGRPVTDRTLQLLLRKEGDQDQASQEGREEQTYNLRRSASRVGFSEATLPALEPGKYTVQLVGEGDPPVLGREENLIVAEHSVELTQVRMDRRRLVQLAAREEGRFAKAAEVDGLLSALAELDWQGDNVERQSRWDVRAGWPLLFLLVSLLAAEWYLRRRHGLL
ncbi:MAG: hypothetical protein ACI9UK_000061 [Candidatus Krumholzibacteriia bacterium]